MLELLKKEIEKKIQEKGDRFAGKYAKLGFWTNPFLDHDHPMEVNFEQLFVGREDTLKHLSDYLVESLTGICEDVAVIAPRGYGARSLVNIFKYLIKSLEGAEPSLELSMLRDKIGEVIDTPICNFTPELRDEVKRRIVHHLRKGKMVVLTSDFGDEQLPILSKNNIYGEATIESFRKILEFDSMSHDRVIYISPWTASSWLYMAKESPTLRHVYEKVVIVPPMTESETVKLLKRRMNFFKLETGEKTILTDDVLKRIAIHSGNMPRHAIELAGKLVEHCVSENIAELSAKKTDALLNQFSPAYCVLKKRLETLIPPKKPWQKKDNVMKLIMLNMIYLSGRDVTATEIGKVMEKSRPAISRNLSVLEKNEFITKSEVTKQDERKVPYSLNDFARAVFENEIIIPEIIELNKPLID